MKKYIKPQTEIINAEAELHLLAGSQTIDISDTPTRPEDALAPGFHVIEDDDEEK